MAISLLSGTICFIRSRYFIISSSEKEESLFITSTSDIAFAQRLAAQLLGSLRFVVTILTGKLKPHIGVRSLSLGQVSCSRVLGALFYSNKL
jgi:hypothetical protein